jgi:anti-sigma B factor antagonist
VLVSHSSNAKRATIIFLFIEDGRNVDIGYTYLSHPQSADGEEKMQITTRYVGEVAVLDCAGRIVFGKEGSGVLHAAIHNLVAKGQKLIVLNLAEVPRIDSSGVGEFVGALTAVRDAGGQLKLVNLQEKIRDLLRIMNLCAFFDVYGNEAEALASF